MGDTMLCPADVDAFLQRERRPRPRCSCFCCSFCSCSFVLLLLLRPPPPPALLHSSVPRDRDDQQCRTAQSAAQPLCVCVYLCDGDKSKCVRNSMRFSLRGERNAVRTAGLRCFLPLFPLPSVNLRWLSLCSDVGAVHCSAEPAGVQAGGPAGPALPGRPAPTRTGARTYLAAPRPAIPPRPPRLPPRPRLPGRPFSPCPPTTLQPAQPGMLQSRTQQSAFARVQSAELSKTVFDCVFSPALSLPRKTASLPPLAPVRRCVSVVDSFRHLRAKIMVFAPQSCLNKHTQSAPAAAAALPLAKSPRRSTSGRATGCTTWPPRPSR